jgi:hypothetical protein
MSNINSVTVDKSELREVIELGEFAKQKEDEINKIEITYHEKDVTEFIVNWLEENRVRTPFIIEDLFDQLNDHINVTEKINQDKTEIEKRQKKSLKSGSYYKKYLKNRQGIFDTIIKNQEKRLTGDWMPPELDALIATNIIYARKSIVEESEKIKQTLLSIQVRSRHFNHFARQKIYEKTKFALYSILVVNLRILEIDLKLKTNSKLSQTLELLEWDLNTLQFSRYAFDEYAASLLKSVWDKKWNEAFTEETKELIRLFR